MADEKKLEEYAEELNDEDLGEVSGGGYYKPKSAGALDIKKILRMIRSGKTPKSGNTQVADNNKQFYA